MKVIFIIAIIIVAIILVNVLKNVKANKLRKNLIKAVKMRDKETVQKLIQKGANINQCQDEIPLEFAIVNSDKEMVSFLIEHGADVNALHYEKTMLDFAKDKEIITILKNHNAKTKKELDKEALDAYSLGLRYFEGDEVSKDYKKAVELFRKAIDYGNSDAKFYLGLCYVEGLGVEKRYDIAYKLCKDAAEQGNVLAQYNLGCCCEHMDKKDEAFMWWEKAADKGFAPAQYNLGLCYYEGRGCGGSPHYRQAFECWEKAAEQGDEDSKNRLMQARQNGLY